MGDEKSQPEKTASQATSEGKLPEDLEAKLSELITENEKLRIKHLTTTQRRKKRILIGLGIGVALAIFFKTEIAGWMSTLYASNTHGLVYGAFIVLAILACLYIGIPYWTYNKHFKKSIILGLFDAFGNFKRGEKTLSEELLQKSHVFSSYNEFSQGDSIVGTHKDVQLSLHEITLKQKAKKSKSSKTVFKGLVILSQFQRSFTGQTVVSRDKGALGNLLENVNKGDLNKTQLESPNFENLYEVYTNDPVEARYLLPPNFMVKIEDLSVTFSKSPIELSFFDDMLLIKIRTRKDFFEAPGLKESLKDSPFIKQHFDEVQSILEVLDKLDIRSKTTKEGTTLPTH